LTKFGEIFVNAMDAAEVALMAATPEEAVSRMLPLVFKLDALKCCYLGREKNRVQLAEVGIEGIHG
jgi:hypothetical protein